MIDIRLIRESPDMVRAALARRGGDLSGALDTARRLDTRRRELLQRTEKLKAERNRASEEVARLKREKADASELISQLKTLSDTIKDRDAQVRAVDDELEAQLLMLPNLPLPELPEGDASANETLR